MVLDAIGALMVRDLLSVDDFEALTEPWRELLASYPMKIGNTKRRLYALLTGRAAISLSSRKGARSIGP